MLNCYIILIMSEVYYSYYEKIFKLDDKCEGKYERYDRSTNHH